MEVTQSVAAVSEQVSIAVAVASFLSELESNSPFKVEQQKGSMVD